MKKVTTHQAAALVGLTEREAFERWWKEPDAETGQSYADCYGSPVIAWLAWTERAALAAKNGITIKEAP